MPEDRAHVPPGTIPSRVLVIGCGNTLFGDDAVGPMLAEMVDDLAHPGVLALAVHELTPELAAHIAGTEQVIFVDACLHGGEVTLTTAEPAPSGRTGLNHAMTPGALLALTQSAFGRCPPARLLLVPGSDFELGHELSDQTRTALPDALARLRAVL